MSTAPRGYMRPMARWWRRDPYFTVYMAREATAIFVVAYALVLLAGVICLARGEAAYASWLAALASPTALVFHGLILAVFAYHTFSWFRIMPKTMPPLSVAGRRVPACAITGAGLIASAVASIAMLLVFAGLAA